VSASTTVALVGVGGQGILLASVLLANAALTEGHDVKASEVKGMAQRGGSVLASVRFGRQIFSPIGPHADVVIATELLEGRRALGLLRRDGVVVSATTRLAPGAVLRGERVYPDDLRAVARARGLRVLLVDAQELAREAGTLRAANVALLGAASTVLPLSEEAWHVALERILPERILQINRRAFDLGRDAVTAEEVWE
jgi:indolepyruvate ferredoxin oxidoreductase beta subunit